jgi:hypothetical protein
VNLQAEESQPMWRVQWNWEVADTKRQYLARGEVDLPRIGLPRIVCSMEAAPYCLPACCIRHWPAPKRLL